ncbi:superfamily protein, partial [Pseudomonas caricapapayae]
MITRQLKPSTRPALKPYFWTNAILLSIWTGFALLVYFKAQENNMELRDLHSVTRRGIVAIIGTALLVYSGHWWGKAIAHEKAELAAYKSNVAAQVVEQQAVQKRTYALEMRGVGVAVGGWHQSSIWRKIKEKKNNFTSIYSQDPKDYTDSLVSRENTHSANTRAAFKHSAGESVAYWPLPTFAIAPPKQPSDTGAADNIMSGRNAATLGVTLVLWQEAENALSAQSMIEHLLQFFEKNLQVPEALIVSRDGDVTRNGLRVAGTPGLQNVQVVPTVFESMTGLLVTRSDRVDRYIRPYATNEAEENQNKNTDLGKLWAFYWNRDDAFTEQYESEQRAKGVVIPNSPGTMSTAYWQAQL